MAKRRKHKRHAGRRRRVGSTNNDGLMLLLGAVVGGVGARFANAKLIPLNADGTPKVSPKIIALVEAVGGGVLAWKVKNDFVKGLGIGIASNGVIYAGQSFGFLSGIAGIGETDLSFTAKRVGFPQPSRIGDAVNSFPNPASVGRGSVGDNIGSLIG